MSKSFRVITSAILSLAAGGAAAQSNVSISGIIDAGIGYEDDGGPTGRTWLQNSGNMQGSRLIFSGKEDLGNGVSALFVLENGFAIDTGAITQGGNLFGRQAYVGLSGHGQTLLLGKQYTPSYNNYRSFDPFLGLAGDTLRVFNYSGTRINNAVSYSYAASPGIRAQLFYALGEVAGDAGAGRTVGAYLGYQKGPLDVVLTHVVAANATDTLRTKATILGGNYDFKFIRVYAAYGWNHNMLAAGTNTRDALVGFNAPVSARGTVVASLVRKTNRTQDHANGTQVAVGYTYDLSKRSKLYGSYGELRNDSNASYRVVTQGATNRVFHVGLWHRF